jgi:UDP-N-acetylmuramoyl-tripeptide--D-alanyl-D-alanine ligase
MYTLTDLLDALIGIRINANRMLLSDAVIDSRQVTPASLFIALPGERVDGHNYIVNAFERGALVALVEKEPPSGIRCIDLRTPLTSDFVVPEPPFCLRVENTLLALQQAAAHWRRQLSVGVIGITGSVGKSTTKELVAEVLSRRFNVTKNLGNYNNEIGLPLTMLRMTRATQVAVLEMGFYVPGEIRFLCDLALPRVGIVTNVGTVHAERAGSQESIARGKAELVENLPVDGTAILNMDDSWVRWMVGHSNAPVLSYGTEQSADITATDIVGHGLNGIEFTLHYREFNQRIQVPLIGKHSINTVLRAAAAGFSFGMEWEEILEGLRSSTSQLRLTGIHTRQGALVLDDTYNASPESTVAALDLLSEIPGRHVAVLGDMLELGPYEESGHRLVGEKAATAADRLVTVGSRARVIADAAMLNGMTASAIISVESVSEATEILKSQLNESDVVLIKGSHGLRMDRIVTEIEASV